MFSLIISIIAVSLIVFWALFSLYHSEKYVYNIENCNKNVNCINFENKTKNNFQYEQNNNSKFKNIPAPNHQNIIEKEEINNYDFSSIAEILKILIGIFSFYFVFRFITKNFKFSNFILLRKTKKIIKLSKKTLSLEDNFKILKISDLIEYQIQYNQEYLNFNNDKFSIELKILTKELVDIQNIVQKKYIGIAH